MVKTSSIIAQYKRDTRNNSAENVAVGKEKIQFYYSSILRDCDNYVIEQIRYGKTKVHRSYLLPPNYIKIKTIRVYIGSTWYPVTEEPSLEQWQQRTMIQRSGSIPEKFHIFNTQGNLHFELDPIPVEESLTRNLEITFEGTQDPLYFPDDYTEGSVDVANGSASVSGNGTAFTQDMVGRFIQITNGKAWYEIRSVETPQSLTLTNSYQESSASSQNFTIAEMQRTPEEFHYTPLWGACWDYWLLSDKETSKQFEKRYAVDTLLIQQKYRNKSKGNVMPGVQIGGYHGSVPRNYPTTPLTASPQ